MEANDLDKQSMMQHKRCNTHVTKTMPGMLVNTVTQVEWTSCFQVGNVPLTSAEMYVDFCLFLKI